MAKIIPGERYINAIRSSLTKLELAFDEGAPCPMELSAVFTSIEDNRLQLEGAICDAIPNAGTAVAIAQL